MHLSHDAMLALQQSEAAHFIGEGLRRYARLNVTDMKTKFGEVRVYCGFGWHQVHCITHPGYAYGRYPQWLWELDCRFGHIIMRPLNIVVIPLQKWAYRWYYKKALERWPHIRRSILQGADWPELLKGL